MMATQLPGSHFQGRVRRNAMLSSPFEYLSSQPVTLLVSLSGFSKRRAVSLIPLRQCFLLHALACRQRRWPHQSCPVNGKLSVRTNTPGSDLYALRPLAESFRISAGQPACVIAWLGRDERDTITLFTSMDYISDLLSKAKGRVMNSNLEDHGLPAEECLTWRAMNRFFYHPWFRRLWVYQEIILAKELTLLCESTTVTWASLLRLTKELRRTGLDGFLGTLPKDGLEEFEMNSRPFIILAGIKKERYKNMKRDESLSMLELLRVARALNSTFDVDRIYGLLGLVSENVRRRIKIDYSLEERFWEVWVSAGKVLSLLERENFAILFEINDSGNPDEKCPELPSWYPDLRLRGNPFRIPFWWEGAAAGYNGNSPELCTFENSNKLHMLGVCADVVEDAFPSKWCWPDRLQKLAGVSAGLTWHRNCLELARISKMRSQDYLKDYLLTLTAGTFDSSMDGELRWHQDTTWNLSKETFHRMIAFLEGVQAKDSLNFVFTLPFEAEFLRWAQTITFPCQNRSFFTTKHERIGLGPSSITKGDSICIFQGMAWPVVLRWNEEKSAYFVIGHAYVHGIMTGEVFRMKEGLKTGVVELETFIIG